MILQLARKLGVIWMLVLLAGLATGAAPYQALAAPAAQTGPTTWTVLVGGQSAIEQQPMGPAGAWQFMRFYPGTITVNVGDTIVWKLNSAEPHTVTFPKAGEQPPPLTIPEGGDSQRVLGNPLALLPQGQAIYDATALTGSGQLGGDPQFPTEYKLTFAKEGTFEYFCAFHQMMKGTVVVQAAGSAYPKTQAQIDADAAAQLAADAQSAADAEPLAKQVSTRPGPNGTTIYDVNIGYGDGTMAYMRFSPTDLTVHAGDTVEWSQKDVETPHTVTFPSGGAEPALFLVEPQQSGPPKMVLNPIVLAPAGGSTYSGQGYFNSGWIWGTEVPQPGPRTYALTFDTPGTYEYICVLHDAMGMNGHITVLTAGAPSQLPVTGGTNATLNAWWLVLPGLGLIAVGLLLALMLRRRRSMTS
jgi:plastocyanin